MSLQIQLKKSAVSQKQPFASDLAVGELALNYNADGPFLTCKDTAGNVRKLNHVWVGATAPTSPSAGDQWLDTSAATAVLKVYKDSSSTWVNATTIPIATTSVYGTVRLATAADVTNGTSGKIVDAAQLQSKITSAFAQEEITLNDVNLLGDMVIAGDLTVNGTTTTIDTETLIVEDKNIEMGSVDTPTDTTADGGGITLKGTTDKTINWVNATDAWTSSERFSYPLGTAAAPTITFTGDPNTGIYSPGADQVAISTNGQGRLFVDASGNIGNTLNPSVPFDIVGKTILGALSTRVDENYDLQIQSGGNAEVKIQSGASNTSFLAFGTTSDGLTTRISVNNTDGDLRFATGSSERLRITSDGKLGLGTSSPDTLLHISETSASTTFSGPGTLNANRNYSGGVTQIVKNTSLTNGGFAGIQLTPSNSSGIAQSIGLFAVSESYDFRPNFVITQRTDADTMTERFRIDAQGRVGINTTNPQSALTVDAGAISLTDVTADGTDPGLYGAIWGVDGRLALGGFAVQFNTGNNIARTERARIDSSGRLLVGTSTSTSYGSATGLFQVVGTTDAHIALKRTTDNSSQGTFTFAKSRGTVGAQTIVNNGDALGSIRFAGYDGVDYNTNAAEILCAVDGTPGADDMPGRLVFSTTADGASSPTERMRIDSQGRVGIGTTSPAGALSVKVGDDDGNVTSWNSNYFLVTSGDTATSHALGLGVNAASNYSFITSLAPAVGWRTLKYKAIDHVFEGANDSERARIDSSGRLLVGTSSAQSVSSGGLTPQFQLNSSNSTQSGSTLGIFANSASNNCRLALYRNRATTGGGFDYTGGTVQTNDVLGQIDFAGVDGQATPVMRNGATISAACESTPTGAEMPSRLVFSTTADGASSPTERMRISSNGTVDITGNLVLGPNSAPAVKSDTTGVTGADQITNMMSLTQAEYDAIVSPDANTFYVITA